MKYFHINKLMRASFGFVASSIMILVLMGCYTGYKIKDGTVVYCSWNEGTGQNSYLLEGADSKSFRSLSNTMYAKDKANVWYEGRHVVGADSDTFVALSHEFFGKDKFHVFNQGRVIQDADPSTFKILDDIYSCDATHVFCDAMLGMKIIEGADLQSFRVLGGSYAIDKNKAYYYEKPVTLADPVTFQVIRYGEAMDKSHHFDGAKVK